MRAAFGAIDRGMKALLVAGAAALVMASATGASARAAVAPTVRSEIERGAAAAFVCYQSHSGLTEAGAFAACVQQAHAGNLKQAGDGAAAFDTGLYFRAAQFIRIKVEVLKDGDPSNGALADLSAVLGSLAADADEAQARLHISDGDLRDALIPQ